MAKLTPVIEFKLLNEQLIVAHETFMARIRAEAPALLDDYAELAGLTRRVLFGAISLESSEKSSG
ncbi:MAG: hypothetical protein ABIQ16_27335 [Polyangiaceae bacterium]